MIDGWTEKQAWRENVWRKGKSWTGTYNGRHSLWDNGMPFYGVTYLNRYNYYCIIIIVISFIIYIKSIIKIVSKVYLLQLRYCCPNSVKRLFVSLHGRILLEPHSLALLILIFRGNFSELRIRLVRFNTEEIEREWIKYLKSVD